MLPIALLVRNCGLAAFCARGGPRIRTWATKEWRPRQDSNLGPRFRRQRDAHATYQRGCWTCARMRL